MLRSDADGVSAPGNAAPLDQADALSSDRIGAKAPGGSATLVAQADGPGLEDREDETPGEGRIFGRVLRVGDGSPVVGAEVRLGEVLEVTRWQSSWRETTVVSGADGGFEFGALKPGHYRVLAEKGPLISYEKRKEATRVQLEEDMRELGPLELLLYPSRILNVKVISQETGQPLEGARVRLLRNLQRTYETDVNGSSIIYLSPEIWELEVSASGYELVYRVVDLSSQEEAHITIALKGAGLVLGWVTDEAGQPLADVRVRARVGRVNQSTLTDEDGRWQLDHFPMDREFSLVFTKQGFALKSLKNLMLEGKARGEYNVRLTVGQARDPDVFALSGKVVDQLGAPVAGAVVGTGRIGTVKYRETRADEEGRFQIEGVFRQKWEYMIHATAQGFEPRLLQLPPDNVPEFVDITLYPGHGVEGQVVDAWNTPLEGVEVRAMAYERSMPLYEDESKLTDVNGYFSFHSLPDRVRFSFKKNGYSPIDGILLPVDGDQVQEVVMQGPGVLLGQVVDRDTGEPIKSFNLRLSESGRNHGRQTAHINPYWKQWGVDYHHPEGHFRVEDLAAGAEVNLVADAEGYGMEALSQIPVTDEAHASRVVVALGKEGISFSGKVVSPTGAPLPGVVVTLLVYNAQRSKFRFSWDLIGRGSAILLDTPTAVTGPDGGFRFEELPDSLPMDLVIRDNGLALTRLSDLEKRPPSQRDNLVVVVSEGAVIYGAVNKEALPDAQSVTLFAEGGRGLWFSASPAAEQYRFPDLPPGNYEVFLEFRTEDNRNRPRISYSGLALEEGEALEVNFGFEPGYKVEGVVYLNQTPMAGGSVFLRDRERSQPTAPMVRTNAGGRFLFQHVEPGLYEVVAFDGEPDGHEYHDVLFRHPNREVIEVRESNYFGEFHFARLGNLTGRVAPAPKEALQLILRGGEQESVTHRSGMTAPNGGFFFKSLPPGVYELLYRGQNAATPAKSLVSGILMPEDGSDVNLGDLGLEARGSLRVTVEGNPPDYGSGVTIYLLPEQSSPYDRSQAVVAGSLDIGEAGRLLKGLPTGVYHCRAFVSDGSWQASPAWTTLEILAEQTTDVRFSFQPLTMLAITTPWDQRMASLRLEREGETLMFQPSGSIDVFTMDTQSTAVFQPFYGLARGFPPGTWTLKAVNVNGGTTRLNLELKPGRAQSHALSFQ